MQKFLIFFKIIVDTKYVCVIYSQSPSSNTTAWHDVWQKREGKKERKVSGLSQDRPTNWITNGLGRSKITRLV